MAARAMNYNPSCEPLISAEEVAEILQVSQKTVLRMASRNEIPSVRVGRMTRFRASAIDAWVRKQMEARA